MTRTTKLLIAALALFYCAAAAALPLWAAICISPWFLTLWLLFLPQICLLIPIVCELMKL